MAMERVPIAILGASGYTGAELVRLVASHPNLAIEALAAERHAGKELRDVFPHLAHLALPQLTRVEETDFTSVALVIAALPHGLTQSLVPELPESVKIVDLSADFRLADTDAYQQWYRAPHAAPAWQDEAVFGIPEIHRARIRQARLVANSGCFVAASLLPLVPLLKTQLIDADEILIDAASGVSGAGRGAREAMLHCETSEGFSAYGLDGHRHSAEIDQECSRAAGRAVRCGFTPHLLPQNRGILATIHVRGEAQAIYRELDRFCAHEAFGVMRPFGHSPRTTDVRGANYFHMGVAQGHREGRTIVLCAIDNLVKGASGQAIQNANLMLGLPETAGLLAAPLFP